MVTSPTGKGVVVMGGNKNFQEKSETMFEKSLFELSNSMQWTTLEQTLELNHYFPCAVQLPDELVNERKTSEKQ